MFTSTRDGDPELYKINVDGTGLVRLTNTRGYDGGAFFSPDGKRIVYRANHPEGEEELKAYDDIIKEHLVRPTRLEIFVMNADGSEQRQITKNGKANFAPFFHPDGKRIIFSSNQGDPKGRNFDLYLIGDDGQNQEQVTLQRHLRRLPDVHPRRQAPGVRLQPRRQEPRRHRRVPRRVGRLMSLVPEDLSSGPVPKDLASACSTGGASSSRRSRLAPNIRSSPTK